MSKIRIGIVGYGNIGRGVEQAIKRMDWYGNVRYTICFYFSVYLYTSTPLENKIIFTELS